MTDINENKINIAYNMDCLEAMKEMKDNEFDLAIVDPPYGLNERLLKGGDKGAMGSLRKLADNKVINWDNKTPEKSYFDELFRVSKFQIIWGANYFLNFLNKTDGFVVWNKMNGTNALADCELAWQNIKSTTRMFSYHHFSGGVKKKIHPTQKPVALYKWLLTNYAKQGDKILDTHLGSGSSRIACYDLGFDFVGYELDKEYFEAQEKRFINHINQQGMF